MEQFINIFMESIYPNIVSGEYSKIVFTFLTVEGFQIINNNFLLLYLTARILMVVSGWTSNTWDDRLAGKYMSFLERFKPNPIKEVNEVKEVEDENIVKEL